MLQFQQFVAQIPTHLRQYVVEQDYSRYTPIDQATWRFILRQLKHYLSENAHPCYVDGLSKTGICVESIPRIEVMCEKLQQFGWTAVPVSGFIPPAAFMEMQSLSILPIACDMRSLDHILYTPAPDIVHEAAGHAPILVDPQFASYLKEYAQVAKKAIISSEDLLQYEAIRELSDIKENPDSSPEQIQNSEKHLQKVNASISHISEAALLGRMNWWTAEYGLIGSLEKPKIFGAGLLSSVGESRHCLTKKVKKIPLSVDCVETSYDITEEQPQLFVAETFADLSKVLRELEARLAFKTGGLRGLQTAIHAKTVNTVELDSGLQISGKVADVILDSTQKPIYLKIAGPTQLCENGIQLSGHDKNYHSHGFSSPLGSLKKNSRPLYQYSDQDLQEAALHIDQPCVLEFTSGVEVQGTLNKILRGKNNSLLLLSFTNCTVRYKEQTLFEPAWGTFDMAVGNTVDSVFSGPADRMAYGLTDSFVKKVIPQKQYSAQELEKHSYYQKVRDLREGKLHLSPEEFSAFINQAVQSFCKEWLLLIEMLEFCYQTPNLQSNIPILQTAIEAIQKKHPEKVEYIDLGLKIASLSV